MSASSNPVVPPWVQTELPRLWVLFERRRAAIRDVAIERMNQLPVFAALWASIPDDVKQQQEAASNDRTRRAFVDGDWTSFMADLRMQGRMYGGAISRSQTGTAWCRFIVRFSCRRSSKSTEAALRRRLCSSRSTSTSTSR